MKNPQITTTRRVTYIPSVAELMRLNREAIRLNMNRTLIVEKIENISDPRRFPVMLAIDHNGNEMRVMFAINERDMAFIDMTYEEYDRLPVFEIPLEESK